MFRQCGIGGFQAQILRGIARVHPAIKSWR
jgi:hypothetical protein